MVKWLDGSILVIQTAFLGDIILTIPLLRSLKETFHEARLGVITTPEGESILRRIPEVDHLVVYDKRDTEGGPRHFFRLIKRIKEGGYDLGIGVHRSHRSTLLLYLGGLKSRVGFKGAGFSFLYTISVRRLKGEHEVDKNLGLLRAITEETNIVRDFGLRIDEEEQVRAREGLLGLGLNDGTTIVGIHPGSIWPTKRWPASRYAEVIHELVEGRGWAALIFGTGADPDIPYRLKAGVYDMRGKTDLNDLLIHLSLCDLFISNDSGPMHMAAALRVPQVAIFGPTTPDLGFGPYNPCSRVVEVDLKCRSCNPHGPRECPKGHFQCMRMIHSDMVLKALDDVREVSPNPLSPPFIKGERGGL